MTGEPKTHICQSCGMPIRTPAMFGTGEGGLPMEDYCKYCYQDGKFTEEVTMDEMIRLCARYADGNSRDAALVGMKLQYPRLKRWARKEETQHEYHKSINRVLQYIQEHLGENTDMKKLAAVANISPYHFHRIFKAIIGESHASYVKRLRLEYVAGKLQESRYSLGELAGQTGYSSEQALSRAFKKYFSIPPTAFRASFFDSKYRDELVPRVCKVAGKHVISLREEAPAGQSWQKLYTCAMVYGLLSEATESLEIIGENDTRRPSLTVNERIASGKHLVCSTLPEGVYAIFTHRGSTEGIPELTETIFNYWLPGNKYERANGEAAYIKYLSHPAFVKPEDLLTEVYVMINPRRDEADEKGG